ncbi:MAG: MaoC family dehydratase [Massilia sp.]
MRELSVTELKALAGTEVAISDWFVMSADRIGLFAEATDDQQWIHVDAARCERESPFGVQVAHGFLTLSMLSALSNSALAVGGVKVGMNYGLNKVRFPAPVPAGSRIRARLTLNHLDPIEGGVQAEWGVEVEREGSLKPVCVAEWLVRYL